MTAQRAALALDLLPHLEAEAKDRQRLSEGRGHKGSPVADDLLGRSDAKAAELVGVGRTAVAPVISEAQFQAAVLQLAKLGGWTTAHFRAARTAHGWATPVGADGAGFPDLCLVHPTRQLLIFRELKTETGRLRPEQIAWGETLTAAGCDWACWRPSDLDEIAEMLTARSVRR